MDVVLGLTLEVCLTISVSTSKAGLGTFFITQRDRSLFVFPNSLGTTVYIIHFAEILRIMTSTRRESSRHE